MKIVFAAAMGVAAIAGVLGQGSAIVFTGIQGKTIPDPSASLSHEYAEVNGRLIRDYLAQR